MKGKSVIPLLALIGALLGLWMVYQSQKRVPVPPILFEPPRSPYAHAIAGTGIIEASSSNIAIGSPFDLIVAEIFVEDGQKVKVGDPLFQLDSRTLEAQVAAAQAERDLSVVTYLDKKKQFSFYKRLKDTKAVSEQTFQQARFALLEAAKSVKVSQANLLVAKTNVERATVRSPIDGEILQTNLHVGEMAPILLLTSSQSVWQTAAKGTLLLMGAVNPLQVRVDIDEDDAWRYEAGSAATAFVRGTSRINFPVNFQKIEPYIIPKSSFSGATSERVDTRVLQVLYTFEKGDLPVYPGQVLDLFIESKPNDPGRQG
jgi:HlyD family secretion protein